MHISCICTATNKGSGLAHKPSSCRQAAALVLASQSMHIISLSLNMSLESMLLPSTLCLKQRMTADPKHVQHAAIMSASIPSPNTSTSTPTSFCIPPDITLFQRSHMRMHPCAQMSPRSRKLPGAAGAAVRWREVQSMEVESAEGEGPDLVYLARGEAILSARAIHWRRAALVCSCTCRS